MVIGSSNMDGITPEGSSDRLNIMNLKVRARQGCLRVFASTVPSLNFRLLQTLPCQAISMHWHLLATPGFGLKEPRTISRRFCRCVHTKYSKYTKFKDKEVSPNLALRDKEYHGKTIRLGRLVKFPQRVY